MKPVLEDLALILPCALAMVAKFPILGASKTRLASAVGAEAALDFSRASLLDLLERFAQLDDEKGQLERVLLYAPPDAEESFKQLLEQEGLSEKWRLMPILEGDNLRTADLTAKLRDAVHRLTAQGLGATLFIGSDCPELPAAEVSYALRAVRSGRAYIAPAQDGGYVLLGVPHCPAAVAVFDGVEWSCARTCVSQIRRLMQEGFPLEVGATYADVDEEEDFKALRIRRQVGPIACVCAVFFVCIFVRLCLCVCVCVCVCTCVCQW
jgi:hypothetical protein